MEFQDIKKWFLVLPFLAVFAGCRKDVTLKLPEYRQKVVIEASIETGAPALVFLSYSVPYFGEFDYTQPEKAFIRGAKVVVSDGDVSDTLTELLPSTGFIYLGNKIIGAEGRSYTMQVTVEGRTYEARTTIHHAVPLDSLYFKGEEDSLGFLWAKFTEPPGPGAAYRWLAKRLYQDDFFAAPFSSVFDDKFIDGKSFDFAYERGRQPMETGSDPDRGLFKRGDTVVVKFCRIGRAEYEFWLTYYMNRSSNGNPFSAPSNIKSMFTDPENSMGSFVGYAPAFDTLVIGTR